jgi:hypothetical protein
MKALVIVLLGVLMAIPALAAEPVSRTFGAPADRVWSTTEAVLKHMGWDIDKADRAIGFITTESRRLDGEDYGVYAKGLRHRLQLHIKAAGDTRSTVSVERTLFKRERILFVDKDEPIKPLNVDQSVERALLDAIAKAL